MDPNKITQAVAEIVNAARDLALEEQQQQLSPLHVAAIMFELPEGVAKQAVLKSSSEEAYRSLTRNIRRAISRLPKMEPAPDEVYMGGDLKKAFSAATKLQKDKGDSFLGADVLPIAISDTRDVSKALEEAGLSKSQLAAALDESRGSRKVDSQTADAQFDALAKYGVDLTAKAAELDPVIGRDEEIRRVIRVLCRRTKNNPVLIGEPGVGKTAIAEGLALRIVQRKVSRVLFDKRVNINKETNINALVALIYEFIKIRVDFLSNNFVRAHLGAKAPLQDDIQHKDGEEDETTVLFYLNDEWKKNWGGETIVEGKKIEYNIGDINKIFKSFMLLIND